MKITSIIKNTFKVNQEERKEFIKRLIETSTPSGDFFLLMILSVIIITFGLVINNIFLILGGMMVAPLLSPILAIAMGVAIFDARLFLRSLVVFIIACILAVIAAVLVSYFSVVPGDVAGFLAKISLRESYFYVAFVAGIAAAITWAKPSLSATLPGVAVTAMLVPPLSAVGIGIAAFNWVLVKDALLLFNLSFIGILIPAIIIFVLMNFKEAEDEIKKAVKKEEKELEGKKGPVEKVKEKVGLEK